MKSSNTLKSALVIQFVSRYSNIAIQLLITAILARLLCPEQFGLLAITVIFSSFFTLLSDIGLSPAIIQFRDLSNKDISGLFTFSCMFALGLAFIFCCLAFPISWIYGNAELIGLCWLSSLAIIFNSMNMVPNGLLLKEKRFLNLAVRLLVSTLVSGGVAIIMALLNFGTYALIAQTVVLSFCILVWNLITTKIKLGNIHFVAPLKRVFSYSAYQMGFGIVNYFSRNLDNLIIGKVFGTAALGFYDKAYKLTCYPINAISGVASSTLQPFLAEYQDNPDYIYGKWLKLVKALSLVGAFISTIFVCAPREVTILFYGDQWYESVALLQILGFCIYFQMVNTPAGSIYQSVGHTDYLFACGVVNTTMTIIGVIIGVFSNSLLVLTICVSVAHCLHTIPILYFLLKRVFNKKIIACIKQFIPELLGAALAGLASLCLQQFMSENLIFSLLEKTFVISFVYLLACQIAGRINIFGLPERIKKR